MAIKNRFSGIIVQAGLPVVPLQLEPVPRLTGKTFESAKLSAEREHGKCVTVRCMQY
jgi:hypothetical protein